MIDWFRSWHGAPTDNKWLVIGRKANVAPGIVSAVVWALLDYASQQIERGSIEGFDVETYSAFSGFEEAQIGAVINALQDKGLVKNNRLEAWDRRQPKREDFNATERKRKSRDNAPDEQQSHTVTQCHTQSHDVTTEKSREDKDKIIPPVVPLKGEFTQWWSIYPHKIGKGAAEKAFPKARKSASLEDLLSGLKRYIRDKPPDRDWCNPATWLNQQRWMDEPQEINENARRNQSYNPTTALELALADQTYAHLRTGSGGHRADVAALPKPPDG